MKNPFFSLEDFVIPQFSITAKNASSQISLSPINGTLKLVELSADSLKLLVRAKSCHIGHQIILDFEMNPPLSILGVIKDLEILDDSLMVAEITLRQYPIKEWQDFIARISDAQEEINAMIASAKQ